MEIHGFSIAMLVYRRVNHEGLGLTLVAKMSDRVDGISDKMSEGMSVGGAWTYWSLYLYTLDGWFQISFLYIRSSYAETNWRVYFSGHSATRKKHGAFQSVVGVVHQPFAPEWTHHPQMSKRHKLGCFQWYCLAKSRFNMVQWFFELFHEHQKNCSLSSHDTGEPAELCAKWTSTAKFLEVQLKHTWVWVNTY